MNSDFDAPPRGLVILVTLGGIVTAIVLIAGLELWAGHLRQKAAEADSLPAHALRQSDRPYLFDRGD
ncbi:MAG: hypothetical protein Kow00121_36850 [Elainellaceae cyanobacterium]